MCAGIPGNIITYKLLAGAGASGASGAGAAANVACVSPWIAVGTGALVVGGVVGGVVLIYKYRREIAETFENVWDALKNLFSGIFGLAKDVVEVLTGMVHAALCRVWTMVNDAIEWLISFFSTTKDLSKEDKDEAIAIVQDCFDGADKLEEKTTQKMAQFMKKKGASQNQTEAMKEMFKSHLRESKEKFQELKDKL